MSDGDRVEEAHGTGVDELGGGDAPHPAHAVAAVCKHCGRAGTDMKTCTGCKDATYCGVVCQRANWKAGHKKTCKGKPNTGGKAHLAAGQRCEDAEDYDGAEKAYRLAVKADPACGEAHRALAGLMMAVRGDHWAAIKGYSRAVELLGQGAGGAAFCNLCGLLAMQDHHAAAVHFAQRFVQIAPDDLEAAENLAQVLEARAKAEAEIDIGADGSDRASAGTARAFPKTFLIRHAESEYNLHVEKHLATRPELKHSPEYWSGDAVFDPHIFDAALSAHGEVQCRLLHDRIFGGGLRRKPDPAMAALRKCKLVVVSPLLRALQTAGLVFGRPAGTDDGPDDGPEVVVWPNLSEQVLSSGEIGRPGPALLGDPKTAPALAAFPSLRAQLADLPDQWWGTQTATDLPEGLWLPSTRRESDEAAQARVGQLRRALAGVADGPVGAAMSKVDPDGVIAFVGHSCIFHKLLGRWLDNCAPSEVGLVDGKIAEVETPVKAVPLPHAEPRAASVAEAGDGDAPQGSWMAQLREQADIMQAEPLPDGEASEPKSKKQD